MTKAGRLGNKVADTAVNGLKWGQKAAGNVVKCGTKGLDIAKHATEAVERTPFVGTAAAPVTGAAARGTVVTVPGNSTGQPRYGDVAGTTLVMPPSGWIATAQPYTQAQVNKFTRDDGASKVRAHQQMLRAQFPTEPRGKPKGGGRRRQ